MYKHVNITQNRKIFLLSIISVCLAVLVSCQPTVNDNATLVAAEPISTARVTPLLAEPTMTVTAFPSATPTAEAPTATPEPTITYTPEPTPTISPWMLDLSSPFFLFGNGYQIMVGYPNGQVNHIIEGSFAGIRPWSPDGTRVIYRQGDSPSSGNFFIADLVTGEVQHLDVPGGIWSPDGQYLLFSETNTENDVSLKIYQFESGTRTVLKTFSRENQNTYYNIIGWSPDGRKVAYAAEIEGQYDLFTIDIESLEENQLTNDPQVEVHAAWSPTENQLFVSASPDATTFYSYPFNAYNLYLIDEAGNRQLISEFERLTQVSWSPDGQQIAVSDNGLLCLISIDDFSRTCPLDDVLPWPDHGAAYNDPPTFSPDGQWLAFQVLSGPLYCHDSYLLNLLTGELVKLGGDFCYQTPFLWSPYIP